MAHAGQRVRGAQGPQWELGLGHGVRLPQFCAPLLSPYPNPSSTFLLWLGWPQFSSGLATESTPLGCVVAPGSPAGSVLMTRSAAHSAEVDARLPGQPGPGLGKAGPLEHTVSHTGPELLPGAREGAEKGLVSRPRTLPAWGPRASWEAIPPIEEQGWGL